MLRKLLHTCWRWVRNASLWFLAITVGWVVLYRFVDPPTTSLMILRSFEATTPDDQQYAWRDLDAISPALPFASIAAEDQRFMDHWGFDFNAIRSAIAYNRTHPGRKRGASTISQQVAKNAFLWPGRDWLRKGLEVYFTVLIEVCWSKERIMEVYLNIIEMAPGVYGAQAAATFHFQKDAGALTRHEAALLASIYPSPRRWSASKPSAYVRKRQQWVLRQMQLFGTNPMVPPDGKD